MKNKSLITTKVEETESEKIVVIENKILELDEKSIFTKIEKKVHHNVCTMNYLYGE